MHPGVRRDERPADHILRAVTDEALLRHFEAGEEPPGGFHHRQHVQAAWAYLRRHPLPEALARFSAALQRFAVARGKPDLYHETITTAYVLLIGERLAETPDAPFDAFAARHPDLLAWRPSILARYYRDETLASERARRVFVMPDRLAP
jgi:hypothetical protein